MKLQSNLSISFEKIQELISCIYDAALNSSQWESTLEKLVNALHAEQGYMRIINTQTNDIKLAYSYNKDPSWLQAYKDYYIHKDPWLNHYLKARKTFIACTHHLLKDKDYEAMEYHRDLVTPQGIHYGLGGKINIEENISSYLAFNRDKKKQGFEDEYLKILKLLTPHLQKAMLINEKTRGIKLQQNLLSDALNQINSPLLMVNKNRKILFINLLAEQLIEQQAGITIKNNHILFLSPDSNNELQHLIHQATVKDTSLQQSGAMQYRHSDAQPSISILVSPVKPDMVNIDTQSNEHALLVLSTHDHQQPITIERLSNLYKLTKAEARLTVELCHGLTLNEIAEKFSLSKNTLKSQLRSCFNKTGTSRQAELIRRINTGPATIISST